MPATAGRVRMPANNRVHSSAALQTHGIWQSAIGYDPYAPNKEEDKSSTLQKSTNSDPEGENSYVNFQGLLALARITGSNNDEARGACKRCGRVGHLSFQCRNFLSMKDENKEKDPAAIQADVMSELDKLKGKTGKVNGKGGAESEDSENEDEESESSDPGYDSEIERIISERTGKKVSRRDRSIKKKLDDDDDSSDSDSGKRKKRGRSKKKRSGKRESDDSDSSDDGRRKRRKEKRRKKDESSDEEAERRRRRHRKSRKEKRRRRSHHHSDDSASDSSEDNRHRKRKSRRSPSPSPSHSDASDSDDAPRGRRDVKRSEKKSRKRHHDDE